jgi:hypothetical protein
MVICSSSCNMLKQCPGSSRTHSPPPPDAYARSPPKKILPEHCHPLCSRLQEHVLVRCIYLTIHPPVSSRIQLCKVVWQQPATFSRMAVATHLHIVHPHVALPQGTRPAEPFTKVGRHRGKNLGSPWYTRSLLVTSAFARYTVFDRRLSAPQRHT